MILLRKVKSPQSVVVNSVVTQGKVLAGGRGWWWPSTAVHVMAQGFHSGRCFNKVQGEQTQNGSRYLPFLVSTKKEC